MIEDITVTVLGNKSIGPLEENSLMNVTMSHKNKVDIDYHVGCKHLPFEDDEVRCVCIICNHEFK